MKNRAAISIGTVALMAQLLVAYGCSSSDGAVAGTGGSSGAGTGGSSTGGGTGGAGGGGSGAVAVGDPCVNVKNHDLCTVGTSPACWNTCGPLKSGIKNCTCTGGMYDCPVCAFPPASATVSYSCYKLTATMAACPEDPANVDPTGNHLPQSGDACSIPVCQPCGSGTSPAYRDSGGTPKIGYCVCGAATNGKYSCASISEWPPQS